MSKGLAFNFDISFTVNIREISLENILTAFKEFLPEILTQFILTILLGYAEYVMGQKDKPFECDKCGNRHEFIWKTKHGRLTKILTVFMWVKINQLQIQCSHCNHKFYITRKLLGIERMKRIPKETYRKLGLLGALTSFRVAGKITSMFGWTIDKMTIWQGVQKTGEEIEFEVDPDELSEGEADGTGVGIQGIKKRGKELKIFIQKKKTGGVRIAGVDIGNYNGSWDNLFKPSIETMKGFKNFLLTTDGDTSILDSIKDKVTILFQRCLWHIPHQFKYTLWKDNVKRKSIEWSYLLAELIEISAIRTLVDDMKIIEDMVKSKLLRLEKLVHFCTKRGFNHSAEYLESAKGDMFTAITNRLKGKTTSKVERVMRTVNLRMNGRKWSQAGALNATKIRLAYYYNDFDA